MRQNRGVKRKAPSAGRGRGGGRGGKGGGGRWKKDQDREAFKMKKYKRNNYVIEDKVGTSSFRSFH